MWLVLLILLYLFPALCLAMFGIVMLLAPIVALALHWGPRYLAWSEDVTRRRNLPATPWLMAVVIFTLTNIAVLNAARWLGY